MWASACSSRLSKGDIKYARPYLNLLEFAVVPDLLRSGAFDGVFDGAAGVIHVTSPLPSATTDFKRDLIDPAVNTTTEILKSAKKASTIKRVVITSSIGVLLTWDYVVSSDMTKVFTAALTATEHFMSEEKPAFDVVNILPSVVTGKNELNSKAEDVAKGGNATAIGILLNNKSEMPTIGVSVRVDDVARAHIDALKPLIAGNRNYICSSGGIIGYYSKALPKKVEDGRLPLAVGKHSRPIHFNTSKTEEAFRWNFASFEEQVKSVTGHYLELLAAK
ncbi:Bifunctional dihydroflavonol 4-reductase/flavanone 4-reductase [Colletotrichum chlorophyti]|uniref:Bifunctional dihydroflavonol 4-reductase/flavanone 4-reductase n=1 Tax=Colletotrichum chlorophyti TaxID=708187 RepID=A0A1Q8S6B2_9PEZI|nr:Bifunctional dihydroflavonol 4-reductase/flavanone 4-reductase [Colletotrichum chlorophyti]